MNALTGKVATVTGASKGIGAGIAKEFTAQGASVVVNYASSKAGADAVVEHIAANGGRALAVQADCGRAMNESSSTPWAVGRRIRSTSGESLS